MSNSAIKHNEGTEVYDEDKGRAAVIYEYHHIDRWIEILLGMPRYEFSKDGIVYYPVYYTTPENVIERIGAFEVGAHAVIGGIDEDGDPDLSIGNMRFFREPVFYEGGTMPQEKEDACDEQLPQSNPETAKIPVQSIVPIRSTAVKRETASDIAQYRKEYLESPGNSWIERHYRNNHFDIRPMTGEVDSYLRGISAALEYIGRKVTVDMMRQLFSDKATPMLYRQYMDLYTELVTECARQEHAIKETRKMAGIIRRRYANVFDPAARAPIMNDARNTRDRHRDARQTYDQACKMRQKYRFMDTVNTLGDFKKAVATTVFEPDEWAKSVVANDLGIHVIEYDEDGTDKATAMYEGYCDASANYYILLGRSENGYNLITYKGMGAFTYKELPLQVRTDMAKMCMERRSAVLTNVPELSIYTVSGMEDDADDVHDSMEYGYDPHVVVMFHLKSNGGVMAGRGPGEKMMRGREFDFSRLDQERGFSNWRRWFDDAYPAPFMLDGKQWNTVEHYTLAHSLKGKYPEKYETFSLDSDAKHARDIQLARKEARVQGCLQSSSEIRRAALREKFKQNARMSEALCATKDAKLTKYIPKTPAYMDKDLMMIRRELLKSNQ